LSTVQTIPLPERANLEQLKKRAKEIAAELKIPLNEAQLNMARGYGFASWPKLKKHVEMVMELTRVPEGDTFLALACYPDGDTGRTARAVTMLADDPSLRTRDIWHAAACANADGIRGNAKEQGGPFMWEPLLYLCYSRIPASEADVLATATALLDAGADPNAGYLWHGLVPPFTALTGVLGAGESDDPAHASWQSLARFLLERGANANDAQALYNRQFRAGTEHLELLFEFGLGKGDGGPWKTRLGDQMETPAEMVQHQLRWAIHHNHIDRVRLFIEQGVDITTPFDGRPAWAHQAEGRTPIEFAALCGHDDIVELLAEHGPAATALDPVDQFVADVMAGREPHGDAAAARTARQSLVVQAAGTGRIDAVRVAVANGFDVNALGRADAPVEQPWQTALHTAVDRNDAEMVKLLLELGADPSIEDARFHSTPAGWAEHFGNEALAALLS
jgi:ankyrin repeat protein